MSARSVRACLVAFLLLLIPHTVPTAAADDGKWARLDDFQVAKSFKFQRTAVWCWAACMQMCLNYLGVDYTQEKIVGINLGAVMAKAEDAVQVTKGMNFVTQSEGKQSVIVSASIYQTSPFAEVIVNHLKQKKPIILAYDDHDTFFGHCVLLTGVKYVVVDGRVRITRLELRDPYAYSDQHVQAGGKIERDNTLNPTFSWLVEATKED